MYRYKTKPLMTLYMRKPIHTMLRNHYYIVERSGFLHTLFKKKNSMISSDVYVTKEVHC